MIVAFWTIPGKEDEKPRLCVVSDKPSTASAAVNLDHAIATESAVHLLNADEGFTLQELEDGFRQVSPLPPAKLYLTPNRPDRPGFSVSKVKYRKLADSRYEIHFDRDRGWERWEPNKKLY